jgi:hypothetical protein
MHWKRPGVILAIIAMTLATLAAPTAAGEPTDIEGEEVILDHVIFGNRCEITAGTPVTVTISGRRYLQAVATVDCELQFVWRDMVLTTNHGGRRSSSVGISPQNGRVTMVVRRPCTNWAKTWNFSEISIVVRDLIGQNWYSVVDRSGWTRRSCGA